MACYRVLIIAGSDSSGGAGLEADQKVVTVHGCYAMTATAALTAQNTQGVRDIHVIPSAFVQKQIDACIEDIGVDVVKTGMLASAETVGVVADALQRHGRPIAVVDPVMVATTGAQLLPEDAVRELGQNLLPLTTVLTPNIPEAQLLLRDAGHEVPVLHDVESFKKMAQAVQALGPKYVLLKGGHAPLGKDRLVCENKSDREIVLDVLCGDGSTSIYETVYINSKNTHGTGCSLASAIASNIARGMDIPQAIRAAGRYVAAGIRSAVELGSGNGPINHLHSSFTLPFSPGYFLEYLLEREDVKVPWQEYTHHEFVRQLGAGTLPLEKFKYYLIQDYLFLIQFSRANALAAYKTNNMKDIATSAAIVTHVNNETALHIEYCQEFGVSLEDMERHNESQACTAYTRYVLDIGQSSDWLALQIALAPCLLGYGAIARRLYHDENTVRAGNPYLKWIENYVADDYVQAVKKGSELLESHARYQSPSRIEELVKIFIHATKMETGFWDMGYSHDLAS